MKEGNVDGKRTWVDLFAKNRIRSSGYELKYILPAVSNGQKIVKFRPDEVDSGMEKWKSALIGSVYGWRTRSQEWRALPWVDGKGLV